MEIEQATPEQQANLDSMSIEQLEGMVSQEEGAAPVQDGQATTQAKGEAVGSETQTEAQKTDGPPKWFQEYAENMKRELGSFRSLASLKDQLPKLVQEQVNQRMAALQKAQNNANLSPEDQQAQAQLQTQQEALQNFVKEQAQAVFGEAAKDYLPLLSELQEQRQQTGLQNATFELTKDLIPEGGKEVWESVFEKVAKDIEAGVPGAVERFDRLSSNPSEIALAMIQAQRQQVQGQAQKVTQQRQQSAQQAAQGVKTGAVKAEGKKSVAEMSQSELDGLSIAELEAAIP